MLTRWLAAIEANDLAAYQQCLHSEARKVPEYGTAEAMVFWARQIKELFAKGFSRQWEFQKPAEVTERFPAGSVKAFPIVSGKPGRESILLMQDNGQWVIVRLFE